MLALARGNIKKQFLIVQLLLGSIEYCMYLLNMVVEWIAIAAIVLPGIDNIA